MFPSAFQKPNCLFESLKHLLARRFQNAFALFVFQRRPYRGNVKRIDRDTRIIWAREINELLHLMLAALARRAKSVSLSQIGVLRSHIAVGGRPPRFSGGRREQKV